MEAVIPMQKYLVDTTALSLQEKQFSSQDKGKGLHLKAYWLYWCKTHW